MLEWSSYVQGHHVYCKVWTPAIGEILSFKNEPDNSYYQFVVRDTLIDRTQYFITFESIAIVSLS